MTTTVLGSLLSGSPFHLESESDANGFRTRFQLMKSLSVIQELIYTPDGVGRLAEIQDVLDPMMPTLARYAYDIMGRRKSLTFASHAGADVSYGYDVLGRLTAITNRWDGTPVSSFGYLGYDDVGNYQQRTESRSMAAAPTLDYTYDDLYRVQTVSAMSTPLESLCYDSVGNRSAPPSCAPTWSYQVPNRLTSDTTWAYGYDPKGNPVTKSGAAGNFTLSWNNENQLTSITNSGTPVGSAQYDVFGRCVKKPWYSGTTPVTRRFVYDGSAIVAELDDLGAVTSYVHGPGIDEPLLMLRGANRYHYFSDLLGSVTEVAETSGPFKIRNRYSYSAFGQTTLTSPDRPDVENPFAYTGREWETNWKALSGGVAAMAPYSYRARYYDPAVGRFLSEDPIGFSGGINSYSYVENGPMLRFDPYGLELVAL